MNVALLKKVFIFKSEHNCFAVLCFCCTPVGISSTYACTPSLLSLPPPSSHPSRSSPITELSALRRSAASRRLSVLHTVMYLCQFHSLGLSHPLLPCLCPQVCSLHLCLYPCSVNRFISTCLYRCHMYTCINKMYIT